MDFMNFDFSQKNIPLGDRTTYMEMMIGAIEKFDRNLSWRAYFKLNPHLVTKSKENFGFRSTKAAPRVKELNAFERDLVKLLQNVKFRRRGKPFLTNLKEEVKRINQKKELIIPADKTSNFYLVPTDKYEDLVNKEIHKKYKKAAPENVRKVNSEHAKIAVELEIDDRMFKTTPRDCFITLKDHKEDFTTNPKVRLINPTKPEVGRVAMKIVDNVVKEIRLKNNKLKQAISTGDVIEWFKDIKNKKYLKFINWDIDNFYPSITPTLLEQALDWAMDYVDITTQQRKIINQSCNSFLHFRGQPWMKKGDDSFDIGMGAYHGAQVCEIVGLFLMSRLAHIKDLLPIIYRDDVLGVTRATSRQQERMRQMITKVFSEYGMSITIFINLKKVNFLDITLDLENDIYKPYRKPGDRPLYVHSQSNHPPQVIKNIPAGIERRLIQNSCNEEVFLEAVPDYQNELERCGYDHKLAYNPPVQPATKSVRRNPPLQSGCSHKCGQGVFRVD